MFTGALILNILAGLWLCFGLSALALPRWSLAVPVLVSVALVAAAYRASLQGEPRTPEEERRIGRLIARWSIFEGVAFSIGIFALLLLHRPSDITPLIAVIVGLHFLPLARGIPMRIYYATGIALILTGAVAFFLPVAAHAPVACLASGIILWASSAAISAQALT